MRRIFKHIIQGICGVLLVSGIACSFVAGQKIHRHQKCLRLDVRILDSLDNSFVSKADIRRFLDKEYKEYIGLSLDSIDLVKMEEIIDRRSAVLKSQAYVTKDGTLHIDVTQRKPVVRFQKKDGGFYADADGCIFPLQNSYASHVQIIDGHIPIAGNSGYKGSIADPQARQWFEKMMALVNYIENSKPWNGKIVQIHIEENGDIVLVPRIGNERFIFGQPDDIEDKFDKLSRYYKVIIPEKGTDAYKDIDLRFRGQIVCR